MANPRKLFYSFFLEKGKELSYKKGEMIIRSEDPPSGIFYLEQGYVKIYSITEDGEDRLHVIYKPGEIFPLIWAMKDVEKNIYYEALNSVTLLRVSKKEFIDFIASCRNAITALSESLADYFDIHIDRIDNLQIPKSYPRLIARLLYLVKRFGRKYKNKGSFIIEAPITHKEIANSIALTRETVSREISKLEKKKIISSSGHSIIVNSIGELKKELSEYYLHPKD